MPAELRFPLPLQPPEPFKPANAAPPKAHSPKKAKQSISTASIFRQKPSLRHNDWKPSSQKGSPLKRKKAATKGKDTVAAPGGKDREKAATQHPLAIAFNETTHAYRLTVYNNAAAKINAQHDELVRTLHATQLSGEGDGAGHPLASSSKLVARMERESACLREPLGTALLELSYLNKDGIPEKETMEFGRKVSAFENHVKRVESEIAALQTQWERVVGEIWKCGEVVLGKETMSKEFIMHAKPSREGLEDDDDGEGAREEVGADGAECLSVGEQKENRKGKRLKKCVSFKDTVEIPPKFLSQASTSKKLPALPAVPVKQVKQVKQLEKTIGSLGNGQVAELKNLQKEHEKWYNAKMKQLVAVMVDEE